MDFLTAYYWQKVPENRSSLLLQQGVLAKRRENILFGCVATAPLASADGALPVSEAGYLTRQLQDWYRREAVPACVHRGAKCFEALGERLAVFLERADAELSYRTERAKGAAPEAPDLTGCLFVEEQALFFYRGRQRIYLLNNRFARANIKRLTPDGAETFQAFTGTAQPGVGLLLATEPFYECVTEEMIRDCLALREIGTEERAGKRLGELGNAAERAGADSPCALYVLVGQTGGVS